MAAPAIEVTNAHASAADAIVVIGVPRPARIWGEQRVSADAIDDGWLRELGFPLGQARVSALRQLVLQAPAPVVADALGFHQSTTTRQHAHAGGAWNRYPAHRTGAAE